MTSERQLSIDSVEQIHHIHILSFRCYFEYLFVSKLVYSIKRIYRKVGCYPEILMDKLGFLYKIPYA